jgi:hypothetical protein
VECRHRGRRSASTRAIEQELRHDLSSGSLDEPTRVGRECAAGDARGRQREWATAGFGTKRRRHPDSPPPSCVPRCDTGVAAAGQQKRSRRRAQRRRMELRVAHPCADDPVDVRRLGRPAITRHRGVPNVIELGVDRVRRALRCTRRLERRPIRHRIPDVDVDLAP